MDLTVYLFDTTKALRAVITRGIVQLIHKERARTLNAEIPVKYAAKPGEYLGFRCVDGRFRMFCIEYADDEDNTATTIITATDAAKDELAGAIVAVNEQESVGMAQAAGEVLAVIGWRLGEDGTDGRTTAVEGGLRSVWEVLAAFETDGNLFISPYYEFDGKAITGRVVDLAGKKPVYTGRLVQRGTDAENIVITRKNRPRPMIYPQGADGLTIANAVWSKEKGDPIDKPAGQLWIGVPEAVAKYPGQGQVYSVETDDPAELMTKGWEKAQESAEAGLTATATISDMEMIRGQSWKSIRLFYIVRVRPRFGQDAEAQVIEIARNYVRNDETKITLGEEPDSSANQIRKLAKTTAANVKELGKYKAQWKDMLVTVEELEEYTRTTVTEAWLDLKASTESSFAQLGARLDSTDAHNDEQFRTLSESVLTLESDLDSATAQLAASIAKIEDGELKRLSEAVLDLDANLDSATASLTARVDDNEASITATATELGTRIDLKADKTYVNNLIAQEIEAVKSTVREDISDEVITGSLITTSGVIGALTLGGDPIKKTTISVVTGITGNVVSTTDVDLLNTEVGEEKTMSFYSRGDLYTAGALYKEGKEMAVAGEIYEQPLYTGEEWAYVVGEPIGEAYTLGEAVYQRGELFRGTAYRQDGTEETAQLFYTGTRTNRVGVALGPVYTQGEYTRLAGKVWFEGGTFCRKGQSVRVQGEEETMPLFETGGRVTITTHGLKALTA